jgi:hypothetical protein
VALSRVSLPWPLLAWRAFTFTTARIVEVHREAANRAPDLELS